MAISQEWERQVADYQNSKMNQTEWCKAKGISLATFKYRLTQLQWVSL